jgi:HAD superfamily hydrolase (TIGR01509 family)
LNLVDLWYTPPWWKMEILALVFDFDGLILETEGPIYQSWREVYAAYGIPLPLETWGKIIGTSDHFDVFGELERQVGRELDREALTAQQKQRETTLVLEQQVRPGVEEYLGDAQRLGLKVGLASSSSCKWVTGHLERLGLLAYFDYICARDDVRFTKPDPELFLMAARRLGVAPHQAVAIEDSPNGILAAKRAGLFCLAVPNELTRQLSMDLADLCVDSLLELPLEQLLYRFQSQ